MQSDLLDQILTTSMQRDYLALFAADHCRMRRPAEDWEFEPAGLTYRMEAMEEERGGELDCRLLVKAFDNLHISTSYDIPVSAFEAEVETNWAFRRHLTAARLLRKWTALPVTCRVLGDPIRKDPAPEQVHKGRTISLSEARAMALRAVREAEIERREVIERERESEMRLEEGE
jgi:hypothetical protein